MRTTGHARTRARQGLATPGRYAPLTALAVVLALSVGAPAAATGGLDAAATGGALEALTAEAATATAGDPDGGVEVARAAGADRIATAVAAAQRGWQASRSAVLATSEDFPDALAAGALAARWDAPLLLTGSVALSGATAAELERLGVAEVWMVGGPAAVSDDVRRDVEALAGAPAVARVAGTDRYATAAAIAGLVDPAPEEVLLASGVDFPDAVAGAALLARGEPSPVLLTAPDALPEATAEALDALAPAAVRVLGGSVAVAGPVAEQAARQADARLERLAGPNRYATSRAIANAAVAEASGLAPAPLTVATGQAFPDALAAGALAARRGGPVLLVPSSRLGEASAEALAELRAATSGVTVIGGPAAVSEATLEELAAALDPDRRHEGKPVALTDEAVIVAADDVLTVDDARVELAATAEVAAGDVVVGESSTAAPAGFLRRLTNVEAEAGRLVADTEPAALTDVIAAGAAAGVTSATAPDPEVAASADLQAQSLTGSGACDAQRRGIGVELSCVDLALGDAGGAAVATADLTGGLDAVLSHDIVIGGLIPSVEVFELTVDVTKDLALEVSAEESFSLERSVELARLDLPPVSFSVGPVPVYLEPIITVSLDAAGELTGDLTLTASESVTDRAGARYTASGGWRDLGGRLDQSSAGSLDVGAALELEAGPRVALEAVLYGVRGIEISASAYARAVWTVGGDPPWYLGVGGRAELDFSPRLPVIGELTSHQATIYDSDLLILAQGPRAPGGLAFDPAPPGILTAGENPGGVTVTVTDGAGDLVDVDGFAVDLLLEPLSGGTPRHLAAALTTEGRALFTGLDIPGDLPPGRYRWHARDHSFELNTRSSPVVLGDDRLLAPREDCEAYVVSFVALDEPGDLHPIGRIVLVSNDPDPVGTGQAHPSVTADVEVRLPTGTATGRGGMELLDDWVIDLQSRVWVCGEPSSVDLIVGISR